MDAEKNLISVVVPTWNEEKNIAACLRAIRGQESLQSDPELIVVDGGSTDKTVEIARQYADRVVMQTSPKVGGARNDGVRAARGDVIATTDADCVPKPKWLHAISDSLYQDSEVVAATGDLHPIIPEEMGYLKRSTYKELFRIANSARKNVLPNVGFYHLCGANTAFRKDAFVRVGGYSDLPYSDDIELAKRISKEGRIVFDSEVAVDYSIRRIEDMGIGNYIKDAVTRDAKVMVLKKRPTEDKYTKKTYG